MYNKILRDLISHQLQSLKADILKEGIFLIQKNAP
ncbi:hypothetical protein RSOCI_00985 [Rhabdochlamydiaceae symbiont of Dictyostelium giganteum]